MGVTVFENHSKSLISKWKSTLFEFSRQKWIHLHQYISCAKIQTFYFAVQKEEILGMRHFCCDLKHCVIELLNNEVFRIWRWKKSSNWWNRKVLKVFKVQSQSLFCLKRFESDLLFFKSISFSFIFLRKRFDHLSFGFPNVIMLFDVIGISKHFRIRITILGRVAIGIVAHFGQHGRDVGHVFDYIVRNGANPFGHGF